MSRIRSNRLLNRVTVPVMTLAAVSWWQIARADAVLDWNAIAAETISTASPPRPGPVGFLDMAVVQAAVYDAVQAIDGKFKPYHVQIPGASGSPEAAAAKAAHDVLANIIPAQGASLDTAYRDYLAKKGLAESDHGVAVGQTAAAGILALRANDGRVPNPLPPPFTGDTATGVWRPTTSYQPPPPPSGAPMATPWLGAVPCFAIQSGEQFRAKPSPALNSQQYVTDYNEVKALGARPTAPGRLSRPNSHTFMPEKMAITLSYGTARSGTLPPLMSKISEIMPDYWRSPTSRWPMRSSPLGTARNTMFCGDQSPPSSRVRTTAMRLRPVIRPGSPF
jgi:hypothetical protein